MSDGKRAVDSDKVWTSLITNTAYLPGLLTLDYSLKRVSSRYPLVALYSDAFPAEGRAVLAARGIPHQRIEYLLPTKSKDYSADPRFYDCWSKLAPFSLTQYDRVVQLDADMLVLRNMDELMDLPLDDPDLAAAATDMSGTGGPTTHPPLASSSSDVETTRQQKSERVFAAGHACVCNPLRKPHYPPDWIPANCAFTTQHADPARAQDTAPPCTASPLGFMNGGLQVVRPSRALFAQILARLDSDAVASMDFADQSLLSGLYAGRWVPLPYTYNALKTMRWPGVHDAIWRDDQVRNLHLLLSPKPWDELDEEGNSPPDADTTHHWWAEANKERQRLEREANVPDDGF